jgi:hypothetical protein
VEKWWLGAELNRRHKDFQSSALPTELPSHCVVLTQFGVYCCLEQVDTVPQAVLAQQVLKIENGGPRKPGEKQVLKRGGAGEVVKRSAAGQRRVCQRMADSG